MGKSEVARLPVTRQARLNLLIPEKQVVEKMTLEVNNSRKKSGEFPPDVEVLNNQVAGHMDDGKALDMMRTKNGTVLKPITKPACGEREIGFYEELKKTKDETLIDLKQFVPKYYGVRTIGINGKEVKCIELEDLTRHYKEPCIMDIKIGKRTWDPNASYEKIMTEEKKYMDCKKDLGFCIPGFQVYKISNNRLCKYGKEYGKRLTKDTVVETIKKFLNADMGLSRTLLVQILSNLWRILHWARKQRRVHLYASSLLLIYDARRLREYVKSNEMVKPSIPRPTLLRSRSLYRPLSLAVLNNCDKIPTGFSGQLTKEGPILRSPTSPNKIKDLVAASPMPNHIIHADHPWRKTIRSLKRTHSFQNNYDKEVQTKKQDYMFILDELVMEQKSEIWTTVKMIDFAHAFPAEDNKIDANYLNGVENLVKLFEDLLMETELY